MRSICAKRSYRLAPGVAMYRSILLALLLVGPTAALADAPVVPDNLVGWWQFEAGSETDELTGNWGDLTLEGDASISDGQLVVNSVDAVATGWARSAAYGGADLSNKTLVSWVSLDDIEQFGGSALTLDGLGSGVYDGLVYGGLAAYNWEAGSNGNLRTQSNGGQGLPTVGSLMQVSASYEVAGSFVHVTLCRNGAEVANYYSTPYGVWTAGAAEVVFGARQHLDWDGSVEGGLDARIAEARIYDVALDCQAARQIETAFDSDGDGTTDYLDTCAWDAANDADGDDVCGDVDACPNDSGTAEDGDGDGCLDDADSDGVVDSVDQCPDGDDTIDLDSDGVPDDCDFERSPVMITVTGNIDLVCVSSDGNYIDSETVRVQMPYNADQSHSYFEDYGESEYSYAYFDADAGLSNATEAFALNEGIYQTSFAEGYYDPIYAGTDSVSVTGSSGDGTYINLQLVGVDLFGDARDFPTIGEGAGVYYVSYMRPGEGAAQCSFSYFFYDQHSDDFTIEIEAYDSSSFDADEDGVVDADDDFPFDPDESTDTDDDGTGDNEDEFPENPNESADSDGDGVGDNSDVCATGDDNIDPDNDGIPTACDINRYPSTLIITGTVTTTCYDEFGTYFPQEETITYETHYAGLPDYFDAIYYNFYTYEYYKGVIQFESTGTLSSGWGTGTEVAPISHYHYNQYFPYPFFASRTQITVGADYNVDGGGEYAEVRFDVQGYDLYNDARSYARLGTTDGVSNVYYHRNLAGGGYCEYYGGGNSIDGHGFDPAFTATIVEFAGFVDTDGDGMDDRDDPCPNNAENDLDGDGMCEDVDDCPEQDATGFDAVKDGCIDDSDYDNILDNVDQCRFDYAPSEYDNDGDGCIDDSDGDGLPDDFDQCPFEHAGEFDLDSDGCIDDSDDDGLNDLVDICPNDPDNDIDGDGVCGDEDPCPEDELDDRDGDGVCDGDDACPDDPTNDVDGDGECNNGDLCPGDADTDGDLVCDADDTCPNDFFDDSDGDTVCDSDDMCPNDFFDDSDGDGACDSDDACPDDFVDDTDGDSVCDSDDLCPNDEFDDRDSDGSCDSDDLCPLDPLNDGDGDGTCASADPCPVDALNDRDGDGSCDSDDACPLDVNNDSDGDSVCDSDDACPADVLDDQDGDGVCDSDDVCPLDLLDDQDGDGVCDSDDVCPLDVLDDRDGDSVCDSDDVCPLDILDDADGDSVCDSDDACPADVRDDQDGDGSCDSDDVCPADFANDSDGDSLCDSVDPCPADPANDVDGDSLCGGVDPCPNDAGNDADGDFVCEYDGDCDDARDDVYPEAFEFCDGTDNDCDDDLSLAAACADECGDSVVDTSVPDNSAPACPNPAVYTSLNTLAKLTAWMTNPTTSAYISGNINAGNVDLLLNTNCDVKMVTGKTLSGVEDLVVVARNVTISGNIVATGDVLMRASVKSYVASTSTVQAATFTTEAPTVDLRGDNAAGAALCAEAGTLLNAKETLWNLGGQTAMFNAATSANVYGDFSNGTAFTVTSGGTIYHRSDSLLSNVGAVVFDAVGAVDMAGDIDAATSVDVVGASAIARNTALWSSAGDIRVESTGTASLGLYGVITTSGWLDAVAANGLLFYTGATISSSDGVYFDVGGRFDGRGRITGNDWVYIDSGSWQLRSTHDFSGNSECYIAGSKVGSVSPVGCSVGSPAAE